MCVILRYDSIDISYGQKTCVHDASFSLHEHEIIALVGESGSGKSTILKAALRLKCSGVLTNGQITYRGKDLSSFTEKEMQCIRGSRIGMIFQDAAASFCPVRTIGAQIHEILSSHLDISRSGSRKRAIELFSRLRLADGEQVWNSYPHQLSGGMCARVGIASAMLLEPDVLLADEPTSALDVASKRDVICGIMSLRDQMGTSVILVTHNLGIASVADRIIVLKNGYIIESGTSSQILQSPQEDYTKTLLSAVPRLRRHK